MKIRVDLLDLPENDLRASVDEDALDELANSIRQHGQLQAIGVKKLESGRYEVVYGARRTRAFLIIGLDRCDANIVDNVDDSDSHAKKLIENVQRQDLTAIEEAFGLAELIDDGQADVTSLRRQTGKSREWVKTRLALLDLPDDVQGQLQIGNISIGVALNIGQIGNDATREYYLRAAVDNGCTSNQSAQWLNNSQFAETGIISMQATDEENERNFQEPQVVDQKYHCFYCAELYSWRKFNTLVVCGNCQEIITKRRNKDA